jgi:hypothetical protein
MFWPVLTVIVKTGFWCTVKKWFLGNMRFLPVNF